jgi:hypothetical protein
MNMLASALHLGSCNQAVSTHVSQALLTRSQALVSYIDCLEIRPTGSHEHDICMSALKSDASAVVYVRTGDRGLGDRHPVRRFDGFLPKDGEPAILWCEWHCSGMWLESPRSGWE